MDEKNHMVEYQSSDDDIEDTLQDSVLNDLRHSSDDADMKPTETNEKDTRVENERHNEEQNNNNQVRDESRMQRTGQPSLLPASSSKAAEGTFVLRDDATNEYIPTVWVTAIDDESNSRTQGGASDARQERNSLSAIVAELQNELIGIQRQLVGGEEEVNTLQSVPHEEEEQESDSDSEAKDVISKSFNRRYLIGCVLAAVVVAVSIAVSVLLTVASPPQESPNGAPSTPPPIPTSFVSVQPTTVKLPYFEQPEELRAAVKRWLEGENTTDTDLASQYGYPIGNWDVSRITNFSGLFSACQQSCGLLSVSPLASAFNANISKWNVSAAVTMREMFYEAKAFNGDLSEWDVSHVTDTSSMFQNADAFDGDLSSWDVSNVEDMSSMFAYAFQFNGDISRWNVSKVSTMASMFFYCSSFNSDISNWDVSSVTDMSFMFAWTESFNGNISAWDVSSVTTMNSMFEIADEFNGDISSWTVSRLTDMSGMFEYLESFDQDLCKWGTYLKNNNAFVKSAFSGSGCANTSDPVLSSSIPGPLCRSCA